MSEFEINEQIRQLENRLIYLRRIVESAPIDEAEEYEQQIQDLEDEMFELTLMEH